MPVTREQFERFVQERKYLQNVSPRTIQIYRDSWAHFERFGPDPVSFVAGMRQRGKSPIGCNIHIRAMNAFFRWCGEKPIPKLKAEDKIPPTFALPDLEKLLRFRATKSEMRTHLLTLVLLDTGLRISEALSLKLSDVDYENMLLSVKGKGGKNRLVPFSMELRRRLWKQSSRQPYELLFCSRNGNALQYRNVLRALKNLCVNAGINPNLGALLEFLAYSGKGGWESLSTFGAMKRLLYWQTDIHSLKCHFSSFFHFG